MEDDYLSLPPEPQMGNIEYKLKLVNPSATRLQHLVTQVLQLLQFSLDSTGTGYDLSLDVCTMQGFGSEARSRLLKVLLLTSVEMFLLGRERAWPFALMALRKLKEVLDLIVTSFGWYRYPGVRHLWSPNYSFRIRCQVSLLNNRAAILDEVAVTRGERRGAI